MRLDLSVNNGSKASFQECGSLAKVGPYYVLIEKVKIQAASTCIVLIPDVPFLDCVFNFILHQYTRSYNDIQPRDS
jgi:hypothetical protein